jgi:hypothetical protein
MRDRDNRRVLVVSSRINSRMKVKVEMASELMKLSTLADLVFAAERA